MSYLNVGATCAGYRVAAKKHLKEYLKADPSSVIFDPTSMFDDQTPFDGAHIPAERTLSGSVQIHTPTGNGMLR